MNEVKAKRLAAVFRDCYRQYALGVFQIPGPKSLIEADAKGKISYGATATGGWAAVGGVLTRASRHIDFTATARHVPAGWTLIEDFCYTGKPVDAVACMLAEMRQDAPLVIEIHEENRELKRAVERYRGKYLLTKINAFSQLRSLYGFGLSRSQLADYRTPTIESLTLARVMPNFISDATRRMIVSEIKRFDIEWADHYSNYNKGHSWSAFALRGYVEDDPGFIIKPQEMTAAWKAENRSVLNNSATWTTATKHFPTIMSVVKRLPGDKDRVRLMRLTPKGELTRHCDISDKDAGVADGKVMRFHVPIVTNDAVDFHAVTSRGEPLTAHWNEGSLYYLDQRKPHFVENRDPSRERIHLVIDCYSNGRLRAMLDAAEEGVS